MVWFESKFYFVFFIKIKLFFFKLILLVFLDRFWSTKIKNEFKKKNIIFMFFQVKNTLKNNNYPTLAPSK